MNNFAEILAWSKEFAPWQNEAIRRLYTNGVLTTSDKDDLCNLTQVEHGLLPKPKQSVNLMLKTTDLPVPPKAGKAIKSKAVRDVANVNVLKAKEWLALGNQFTIM